MSLENVRARERILAQMTHVRTITSMSKKVTLQVLRVQIGLVTMWAWILAVGVLLGYHALRSRTRTLSWRVGPAWSAGEYATSSLGAHDMSGLLLILHE